MARRWKRWEGGGERRWRGGGKEEERKWRGGGGERAHTHLLEMFSLAKRQLHPKLLSQHQRTALAAAPAGTAARQQGQEAPTALLRGECEADCLEHRLDCSEYLIGQAEEPDRRGRRWLVQPIEEELGACVAERSCAFDVSNGSKGVAAWRTKLLPARQACCIQGKLAAYKASLLHTRQGKKRRGQAMKGRKRKDKTRKGNGKSRGFKPDTKLTKQLEVDEGSVGDVVERLREDGDEEVEHEHIREYL